MALNSPAPHDVGQDDLHLVSGESRADATTVAAAERHEFKGRIYFRERKRSG